jgi:hypothetical protein
MTLFKLILVLCATSVALVYHPRRELLPLLFTIRSDSDHLGTCNHTGLVMRASLAWQTVGITPRVAFNTTPSESTGPPSFDGKNEFVFGPYHSSGATIFHSNGEMDCVVNVDKYPDCNTLYLTVLHEIGHVFGLDHPTHRTPETVMGTTVKMGTDDLFKSFPWQVKPTVSDMLDLFSVEQRFYYNSSVDYQSMIINTLRRSPPTLESLRFCD